MRRRNYEPEKTRDDCDNSGDKMSQPTADCGAEHFHPPRSPSLLTLKELANPVI